MKIDHMSATPLYQQLAGAIEQLIRSGELAPGTSLPSENKMAESLAVSRMTVRQALAKLTSSGYISRQQGKGTYVAQHRLVYRLSIVRTVEEDLRMQGHRVGFKVLSYEGPSLRIAENASGEGREGGEFHLHRIKLVDGEPFGLERRSFPYHVGSQIPNGALEAQSIYALLETAIGEPPGRLVEEFSCRNASSEEAHLLSIASGHPVFVSSHTILDRLGRQLAGGLSVYRGDRYQVCIELDQPARVGERRIG